MKTRDEIEKFEITHLQATPEKPWEATIKVYEIVSDVCCGGDRYFDARPPYFLIVKYEATVSTKAFPNDELPLEWQKNFLEFRNPREFEEKQEKAKSRFKIMLEKALKERNWRRK